MPVWLHKGIKKREKFQINSEMMRCLRNIHKIRMVEEMRGFGDLLATANNHKAQKNCTCKTCRILRCKGCKNPNKCSRLACKHISRLQKKWSPLLLKETRTINKTERQWINEEKHLFRLDIKTRGTLKEGFRVFTESETMKNDMEYNCTPGKDPSLKVIYTDRSCIKNENEWVATGAGIWFSQDNPRNRAICLSPYIA